MTKKTVSKSSIGKKGEDLAAEYIIKKGWRILHRNYHCLFGEIDIIAQHDDEIIFIEVKTRMNEAYGNIFETIPSHKLQKMKKAGETFLLSENLELAYHFDAILISYDTQSKKLNLEHIESILSE